jgi:hypothetical protein
MARNPKPAPSKKGHVGAKAERRQASKPKATARAKTQKQAPAAPLKSSEGIKTDKPKRKFGAPTKYDPAYCDLAIELGEQGKSAEVIACHIGVIYQTMVNWSVVHPDFLVALELAKQLEMRWWEDKCQENLMTTGFAVTAWGRNMSARFPKKWREKTQVDHGISNELAALLGEIDGNSSTLV